MGVVGGGEYEAGQNKSGVPECTWSDGAVQATELSYYDVPPTAFLVSGPLDPFKKGEVRCLTDRRFPTTDAALEWAKTVYPRVYRDESRPAQGVWAFRVEPVK